jgi:hypothetical protein
VRGACRAGWNSRLAALPGYTPAAVPGGILKMTAALPWWRYTRAKAPRDSTPSRRVGVDQ